MSQEVPVSSTNADTVNVAPKTLDERINAATVEDHQAVLDEIAQINNPIVQDSFIGKLANVLKVSRTSVSKVIKEMGAAEVDAQNGNFDVSAMRALFPGLVDLVHDDNGKVRYLIKEGDSLRLAESWQDTDGNTYVPPADKFIKFLLPNATRVMNLYNKADDKQLFEDLLKFFKRFSYLEDDVWPIIVLAVFLSYIQDHPDVHYIPVIYFFAVAERGKSRTAKTILSVGYRGQHLTDIRPANIFRFSQNLGATIFFDVTDLWKSAEKADGHDILLGRFEKGCQVVRVLSPDKGPFADQTYFDIYGSTVVATNEPANLTFESRCLSITMPNRPGEYENLSPEMGLPFKERLTAWRARMMDRRLPHVDPIPGISGRLWDISRPLFQLESMIAPNAFEQMKKVILEMAGHKIEDKKSSLEGKIVEAIRYCADFNGDSESTIPVSKIRDEVNSGVLERYHHTPQKIGKRIESLSIRTKNIDGRSQVCISESQLKLLMEQYGLLVTQDEETLPQPTTRSIPLGFSGSAVRVSAESQPITGALITDNATRNPILTEVVESGRHTPDAEEPRRRIGWAKKK